MSNREPDGAEHTAQTYQYKVIDWNDDEWWTGESFLLGEGSKREWDAEKALNKYAESGWELDQALSTNSKTTEITKLILKRPKND